MSRSIRQSGSLLGLLPVQAVVLFILGAWARRDALVNVVEEQTWSYKPFKDRARDVARAALAAAGRMTDAAKAATADAAKAAQAITIVSRKEKGSNENFLDFNSVAQGDYIVSFAVKFLAHDLVLEVYQDALWTFMAARDPDTKKVKDVAVFPELTFATKGEGMDFTDPLQLSLYDVISIKSYKTSPTQHIMEIKYSAPKGTKYCFGSTCLITQRFTDGALHDVASITKELEKQEAKPEDDASNYGYLHTVSVTPNRVVSRAKVAKRMAAGAATGIVAAALLGTSLAVAGPLVLGGAAGGALIAMLRGSEMTAIGKILHEVEKKTRKDGCEDDQCFYKCGKESYTKLFQSEVTVHVPWSVKKQAFFDCTQM